MATIGEQLLLPETGWKRIDDNDINIAYSSNFVYGINANCYNGTFHQVNSGGIYNASFNFYGTKFRLIGMMHSAYYDKPTITIDGTKYDYNITSTGVIYQALVFEKTGLPLGEHSVSIDCSVNSYGTMVDAIDIDDIGYLSQYNPNPTKYLAKTSDGHYHSSKSGSWVDLGIPADTQTLEQLFKDQGEDACPTHAYLLQLGANTKVCYWRGNASAPVLNANITSVPNSQFIHAKDDISLKSYSNLDWIHVNDGTTGYESGNGKIRLLASIDSGVTYYSYNTDTSIWGKVLDTTDVNDGSFDTNTNTNRFIPSVTALGRILSQGMNVVTFNAAPWQDWTINKGYTNIRFGYSLDIAASTDIAFTDNAKLQYDGQGKWKGAINGTDYNYYYDNSSLELSFITGGYRTKVNY